MPEIFSQNSDETISRMAEIEAIRSLSNAVTALRDDMREDKKILQEVRDSLTRLEGADHPSRIRENRKAIEAPSVRVGALEAVQNKRDGAGGVWAAILKSPALAWVVMLAGAVWVWVNNKGDI